MNPANSVDDDDDDDDEGSWTKNNTRMQNHCGQDCNQRGSLCKMLRGHF